LLQQQQHLRRLSALGGKATWDLLCKPLGVSIFIREGFPLPGGAPGVFAVKVVYGLQHLLKTRGAAAAATATATGSPRDFVGCMLLLVVCWCLGKGVNARRECCTVVEIGYGRLRQGLSYMAQLRQAQAEGLICPCDHAISCHEGAPDGGLQVLNRDLWRQRGHLQYERPPARSGSSLSCDIFLVSGLGMPMKAQLCNLYHVLHTC
jgi:hypothetical protein